MNSQPLQDYLSRLSGRTIAPDEIVSLTSAQQAALRSWLRSNGDPGAPARVRPRVSAKMLAHDQDAPDVAASAPSMATPLSVPPLQREGAVDGVGIDIEYASTLPEAEDYRTHPFFAENFSKAEIVHCIESDNPRLSFAGLWAAKEAVAKACGVDARLGHLSRIEIGHDDNGRPTCGFGSISISHAGEMAVAVCVAAQAPARREAGRRGAAEAESLALAEIPSQPAVSVGMRKSRGVFYALGLSAIVNLLLAAVLFRSYQF